MSPDPTALLASWLDALEKRHLATVTFPEARRGVQALSRLYVQERSKVARALEGAGKRAGFGLFYGPLHLLLVQRIVAALALPEPRQIIELGCGTGTPAAGWALSCAQRPTLQGIDRHRWAVAECQWNWTALGLPGRARAGDVGRHRIDGGAGDAYLAAFVVNELDDATRGALLARLLAAAARGAQVLVIEPAARRHLTWWDAWSAAFTAAGGRDDLWHFDVELPALLAKFDRAAGLDHRRLGGRSLWVGAAG